MSDLSTKLGKSAMAGAVTKESRGTRKRSSRRRRRRRSRSSSRPKRKPNAYLNLMQDIRRLVPLGAGGGFAPHKARMKKAGQVYRKARELAGGMNAPVSAIRAQVSRALSLVGVSRRRSRSRSRGSRGSRKRSAGLAGGSAGTHAGSLVDVTQVREVKTSRGLRYRHQPTGRFVAKSSLGLLR